MRMAKEDIGREIVANVVALGAMIGLTGVVSKEAGEEAVLRKVPEAFKEEKIKKESAVHFYRMIAGRSPEIAEEDIRIRIEKVQPFVG